jgi:hypothetical protein
MTFLILYLLAGEAMLLGSEGGAMAIDAYQARVVTVQPPRDIPFGIGFETMAIQARKDRAEFFRTHRRDGDRWVAAEVQP